MKFTTIVRNYATGRSQVESKDMSAGRCVVAKMLKFNRQNAVPRKAKSESDEPHGKVIEFPRQKLTMGKTEEMNAPAMLFGCF
jgi:hypothetical protein